MRNWAERLNILPPCQSGFRKHKSCHDHIARIDQIVTEAFNKRQRTGLVNFDLEKAFDKASHEGITITLVDFKCPSELLNWTIDFLTDRSFFVTWNGSKSKKFITKTGVPQGSCLSPTLFNIFFSRISNYIPKQVDRALYADNLDQFFSAQTS